MTDRGYTFFEMEELVTDVDFTLFGVTAKKRFKSFPNFLRVKLILEGGAGIEPSIQPNKDCPSRSGRSYRSHKITLVEVSQMVSIWSMVLKERAPEEEVVSVAMRQGKRKHDLRVWD
ncbi:hypothetical protein RJT34_19963 [Clitoria ternatea]|uniref:Uncharacterized protein n=1 Tax=Clitoria ternatea TaxID=43366 RepID=A0AAN9IS21_CLITE